MNDPGIEQDIPLPLSSHLSHLRKSLILSAAAISVCSVIAYNYIDPVLRNLAEPVGKLYFISPMEAFFSKLKFSIYIGIFASMPLVLYQVWSFMRGGLLALEKKAIILLTTASLALFYCGSAFCYFLVLPAGVKFLIGYGSDMLVPFISINHYLSFVYGMVFSFGIIFELPLVMLLLVKVGVLSSSILSKNRRLAIVLIFLAAAIFTPTTDVFNQTLMAVPLWILFEIGIIAARIMERRK
jgi:sec-independent protein translocase protein TatC